MSDGSRAGIDAEKMERSLRFAPLLAEDGDAVLQLYRKVSATVPLGFLTERTEHDFGEILSNREMSASIGVWQGNRLVAYSLCSLETGAVYESIPLIRLLRDRGEPLWSGKGTVVDPEFQGQLLLPRLLKMRGELIAKRGIPHTVGLVATSNLLSLGGIMRSGAWVVGIERDAYCENFVCYGGRLQQRCTIIGQADVAVDDLSNIASKLGSGWVGVGLKRKKTAATAKLDIAQLDPAWRRVEDAL